MITLLLLAVRFARTQGQPDAGDPLLPWRHPHWPPASRLPEDPRGYAVAAARQLRHWVWGGSMSGDPDGLS